MGDKGMLLCLSKNTFVRNYGDFTYILGRIRLEDRVFYGAEVFMRWITREALDKETVLKNICNVYSTTDSAIIRNDFEEFIAPLIRDKFVLTGNNLAELDEQEEYFSYDVASPKTMEDTQYLTEDEANFMPQKVLGDYFEEHPTIFRLQMDITEACTERCIHCYIPEYNPIFLQFKKAVEIIDEFADMGGLELSLSGGECMLHPKFKDIVRYARSKDLIVSLLTNLTLCNDEIIDLMKETETTVQVSLYSMQAETHDKITQSIGSWQKTKGAIEKIRKAQIPCRISCPTMKQNFRGYIDVINYARSLKMSAQTDFIIMGKMDGDTSNLSCRLDLKETRELLKDIVEKSVPFNSEYFNPEKKEKFASSEEWKNNKVCGAGIDSLCLSANGNYYPCPAFGGYILGNCHRQSLKDVWLNSPAIKKLRAIRGRDFPKCAVCKDRDYCSVCMCRNFNETQDIFQPAQHFCKVAAINHEVVDELHKRITGK